MQETIKIVGYDSWSDFKRYALSELFPGGLFKRDKYIFRGHGNCDFMLVSSFDRKYKDIPIQRRHRAFESLIANFKINAVHFGHTEIDQYTPMQVVALAQHYGVPTRLLDWSKSPYVAAFFAFHSFMRSQPNSSCVSIWSLDRSQEHLWNTEAGVEVINAPLLENIRLLNQHGMFTLAKTAFSSLEDYLEHIQCDDGHEPALTKINIPASEALTALLDLECMGITPARLFPDMFGAAESAVLSLDLEMRGM